MQSIDFADLVGRTFYKVYANAEMTELYFIAKDPEDISYFLHHDQDCCEDVWLSDIVGNLDDLINTPIIMAYESSTHLAKTDPDEYYSTTWTFYHLATIKGYVTLRWVGTSNGYYSEEVELSELEDSGSI